MVYLKAQKQLISVIVSPQKLAVTTSYFDSPYWGRGLLHGVLADGSWHSPTHLAIVMAPKMLFKSETLFYMHHLLVQRVSCRN